ncbi:MAG: type II methionyl aminopeptidase [Candidatus Woesearchaeota archaeon]
MDEVILNKYKEAGRIANLSLKLGTQLIKPGEDMLVVLEKIEEFIIKEGAFPAFPPQISLNSVAAHFCPEESYFFKENDLAKLDVGVSVDGFIADNALTVDLSSNNKHKLLIEASSMALDEALKLIRPGVRVGEIGARIQEVISNRGFSPIRNLSGHGLARFKVHTNPSIPNFEVDSDVTLEEGMVVAIEPFATDGAGIVYESGRGTIFNLVGEKPLRRPDSRKVLDEIKKYNGLPFSSTGLFKIFGKAKVLFALREMKQLGMLDEHPPLVDKGKGFVSQAEHSVIVLKEPVVYTRFD